jgi:hypothetical protein
MVRTEDLIDALAADTPAASANVAAHRLGLAALVGALAAFGLLLAWLGLRPDLASAAGQVFFWIKLGYALSFALAGAALAERFGRPGGRAGGRWLLLAAPIAALAVIALAISIGRSPEHLAHDWLGRSWSVCPFRILALAAPVFAAALWAFRRLAPTRLRLAGFAAGLLAGGVGASVYCLFCQESTALFVVTWYSLGMLACGAIGALLGPSLLRW